MRRFLAGGGNGLVLGNLRDRSLQFPDMPLQQINLIPLPRNRLAERIVLLLLVHQPFFDFRDFFFGHVVG